MRRLVLVRHGRAEGAHPGGDHERRLVPDGAAAAVELGTWLSGQGLVPGHVTVSTAARARATWASLRQGLPEPARAGDHRPDAARVWEDRRIYDGGVGGVLAAVRETPDEAQVLWVVGHEPGMSTTTWDLAQGSAVDDTLLQQLSKGFPTATAAVLEVDPPWADLAPGAARLVALRTGRPG